MIARSFLRLTFLVAAFVNPFPVLGQIGAISGSTSTAFQQPLLPHSPEATALGKYGEIPVGLNTGVPAISIPIYSFGLKNLNVPITIDYHASGVKVDELASNVGIGWSLNYGGTINEIVYGLNDFSSSGWLAAGTAASTRTPQDPNYWFLENWSGNINYSNDPSYQYLKFSAENILDTQPDLFSFSFPGKSGKFFFDQDKNIHIMPYQKLKIEYTNDENTVISFIITDENGNKFYFNNGEIVRTTSIGCYTTLGSTNVRISRTFYLSKIITLNNEQISFNYTNQPYNIVNPASVNRYKRTDKSAPQNAACPTLSDCTTTSTSKVSGLQILSIKNEKSGEHVDFTYATTQRLDVPGNQVLDNIKVVDKDGAIVKKFDLSHDYFYSGLLGSTNNSDYRLMLTSLTESGKPPYIFGYDNTLLPPRFSPQQDHWGYYNGKPNSSLLPKDEFGGFDTGADRRADIKYMKAGSLNKITYPTGGATLFEFESNSIYKTWNDMQIIEGGVGLGAVLNGVTTVPFTIPENAYDLRATWLTKNGGGSSGGITPTGNTRIRITGPNGFSTGFTGNSSGWTDIRHLGMVAGVKYNLTISNITEDEYPTGAITILWKTTTSVIRSENVAQGGLRIKSITDQSKVGPDQVSYYEYTNADDINKSSGVAMFSPSYIFPYYRRQVNNDVNIPCTFIGQQASSLAPLGTLQGGNVIYKNVNVYKNNKQQGYTSNEFETNGNSLVDGPSAAFPFPPLINVDWINGLPLKTTTYKYNGATNTYFPVLTNEKIYKKKIGLGPNESVVRGVTAGYAFSEYGDVPAEFKVNYYYLHSSWFHLDQEKTTSFDLNGEHPVFTTISYYYDNPLHIQPTRLVSTKSNGNVQTTFTTYPDDYTAGTPFLDDLKANHKLAVPVEQVNYLTNSASVTKVLGGRVDTYKTGGQALNDKVYLLPVSVAIDQSNFKFSNTPIGILPGNGTVGAFNLDSQYEERANYIEYDEAGNLLTFIPKNGIAVGYQWGYDKQYVVASCKNAGATEFYFENFETNGTPGKAFTGNKYNAGPYTVNWVRPNSRTYLISYWYYQNNAWKYKIEDYTGSSMVLSGGTAYDDVMVYPKDAEMTTYTYKPLVGLSTTTDPKGQTEFYEYDEYQRLKHIRDQNNNIIRSNSYHYKD